MFLKFQHGLIHTGDTTYFIEPVKRPQNVTDGHPHIIYQHTPTETDQGHGHPKSKDECGNNGTLSPSLSGTNTQFLNQKMYSQASYDAYNTIIYQSYKLLCHE